MLGDDLPPDELNYAPRQNMNFGFPYRYGKNIPDPEFGSQDTTTEFTPSAQDLGAHVASLGMRFYTGKMFPKEYRNQIFIAEHGSWNRSSKVGYRLTLVTLAGKQCTNYRAFATGWLQPADNVWGRPVDLCIMSDGSMLVSDDLAGAIYRITYDAADSHNLRSAK
jgi:glucose/arabinose dehydrogenase